MTQVTPPPYALVDTPWQACAGLRAAAIDGAASMIIMEVLVDALSRLPQGRAALDAALASRAAAPGDEALGSTATEIAAAALALGLIAAAGPVGDEVPAAA